MGCILSNLGLLCLGVSVLFIVCSLILVSSWRCENKYNYISRGDKMAKGQEKQKSVMKKSE
jgi:hypothetical protein